MRDTHETDPATLPQADYHAFLAAEDAEALAEVDRQLTYLRNAGHADVNEVLSVIAAAIEAEYDPRVVEGLNALAVLWGHPDAERGLRFMGA